jgi:hypothetical protein
MAPRQVPEERLRRTVELVNEVYRDGFDPEKLGTMKEVGERGAKAGLFTNRVQLWDHLNLAKVRLGIEPDPTLFRPRQYQHALPGEPIIPSQDHIAEPEPDGDPMRLAIIGDAHDSPHLPNKERFRWLGAYIAERGIERVVSVGDWWTMDCFSSHTDRATFEGRAKPTFEQDRESFHESQRAFQDGLAGHKPKLHITLGNHEVRAWRYDNQHPDGVSHGHMVEEAFLQWGWRTSPYGEFRFFGGVGVTHVPFNGLGRPLAQGQRANKAMCDIIHGDDHRALQLTDHKSGPFRSPTVYSAASALPPGFIEGFANKGASTWRSGICEAVVWGSYVRKWSFEEMVLLRRRYGQRLAA